MHYQFLFQFQLNWDQPGESIHNFIRGNDKVPGAWTMIDGQVRIQVYEVHFRISIYNSFKIYF